MLAGGVLTGKYRGGTGEGRLTQAVDTPRLAPAMQAAEELGALAEELGSTPAALAVAFALSNPSVASVLFGATSAEQIEQNVRALDALAVASDAQLDALRSIGVSNRQEEVSFALRSIVAEQRVAGVGMHVTDLDRSVEFYTSVLGMHVVGRFEFEGITEVLVGFGELGSAPNVVLVDRAGHPGRTRWGPVRSDPPDGRRHRRHVRAAPRLWLCDHREPEVNLEIPVRIVMAQDPDGYGLELIERPHDDRHGPHDP